MVKLGLFFYIIFQSYVVASGQLNSLNQFRNCTGVNGINSNSTIDHISNSTRYSQLNHQWNTRITHYPLGYFLPSSTEDVMIAVTCARASGIRVIPKGGGHSYESFSFGDSDKIIIDFRLMSQVVVNVTDGTAVIGAGALIGEIHQELWDAGRFGLGLGECVTVGIAGYTIGGGNGRMSHLTGLAIDNLIEFEMVDHQGNYFRVNAETRPDLYWAFRGVGSGYIGIVTSFKFKLFQASDMQITHSAFYFQIQQSLEALDAFQNWINWVKENEPHVQSTAYITPQVNATQGGFTFRATHIQDPLLQPNSNTTFLEAAARIFSSARIETYFFPNYMDFNKWIGFANVETNETQDQIDWRNLRNYNMNQRYFKRKAFYVNQTFPIESLEKVADVIRRIPERNVRLAFWTEGGATEMIPAESTAYFHRDNMYDISLTYEGSNVTEDVAEGMAWINEFLSESAFMDNGETYQNYPDLDYPYPDYLSRYYGNNLGRLLNVKRDWDPENYFQNPQSLPIYPEDCSTTSTTPAPENNKATQLHISPCTQVVVILVSICLSMWAQLL